MAQLSSIDVISGTYPATTAPSDNSLSGKVRQTPSGMISVDVGLLATAGSGTYTLIGWDGAAWYPVGDISVDSSACGGYALGRFTPGSNFLYFAVWEKSAATLSASTIGFSKR